MPDGGRLLIETQKAVIDADQIASGLDMKPGDYVALAVSDTGSGIPRELRDRVFEPFFTTKGHDRGSGLAMIYGFVKQSGGHITLYSEIGHGSTFTIYLPRTGEAASIERAIEPSFAQRSPSESLVLVVEDDPAVRRLNVTRLRNLGYPVSEADSGAQALATIR